MPRNDLNKPLIIAEISCNHGQDIQVAYTLIDLAKQAGADAIKIQLYHPQDMMIGQSNYFIPYASGTPWDGKYLHDIYAEAHTPFWMVEAMFRYARRKEIPIFSSVFSLNGLEQLEKLDCPMYKIASFENNCLEFINKVSQTGKPIIVSTGMITDDKELFDIKDAVIHKDSLTLMHCISVYPTYDTEANINNIIEIRDKTGLKVGFSDHTIGNMAAMAATVNGATVIEKHLISLRHTDTLDRAFSIDEYQFSKYVQDINDIYDTLHSTVDPQEPYKQFKRSLYATADIQKGEKLTGVNIGAFRPYLGLDARQLIFTYGKEATEYIPVGTPLTNLNVGTSNDQG